MSELLRNVSKRDFESAQPTFEDIQTGCFQRIADATEKMASNYTQCQNDRDMYQRWWKEANGAVEKRDRRIASLRGVITRLKRTAAKS